MSDSESESKYASENCVAVMFDGLEVRAATSFGMQSAIYASLSAAYLARSDSEIAVS